MAAALVGIAPPATAQSGQIRGKVTDETGQPVPGAAVEVATAAGRRSTWHTTANESGDYIIITLPRGRYVVTASKDSVGTGQTSAVIASGGVTAANVMLRKPTVVEGPCAASLPSRPFDNRLAVAFADSPSIVRLVRWLEAAQRHRPGCADTTATEVSTWSRRDLDTLLSDIGRLSAALQKFRELKERDPVDWQRRRAIAAAGKEDPVATIRLHERRLTLGDIETIFHGNETLQRGAVLHADIAVHVRDDLSRSRVLVQDGRQKGNARGSVHWDFGRRLLDFLIPGPGSDAGALLWYRAISAYLLHTGRLDESPAHLEKARQVFPRQAAFLIDSAHMHEKLASPSVQAAVQELKADGTGVFVGTRAAELERAVRFLRQALAVAPDEIDARLRLGRTLGGLGRHEEAAVELRRAIDVRPDKQRLYLAELFLGREEQALGRHDAARRHFENAAVLYPTAQSPWLALSQLARQAGDRASALRALHRVTARPFVGAGANDPWWFYYEPHLHDAEALMDQMRKMGSAGGR